MACLHGIIFLAMAVFASQGIDIHSFQPSIIPIDSVTKLTIATSDQLNTSSSIQCRFNDISMPAKMRNNLVFCDTPPMRKTDKAVLHLEVDGKLHKAKTTLRFHESFKVTGIKPQTAFPSQQLHIAISGITCEDWMTFFVRFQTANGTKQTQKAICVNSTVTCYVPVFPAHALLRVGVTLSNRFVEWSTTKLLVQYPVDSLKSYIKDLIPDIERRGAFTFKVVLRDKFKNKLTINTDETKSVISGFDVQYAPYDHPKQFQLLSFNVSIVPEQNCSAFAVSCGGAEHERIWVYPLINNLLVGEKKSYDVTTTLCPGKTSCSDLSSGEKIKITIIIVTCTSIMVVAALVLVGCCKHRRSVQNKIVTLKETSAKSTAVPDNVDQSDEGEMEMIDLKTTEITHSSSKVSPEPSSLEDHPESFINAWNN